MTAQIPGNFDLRLLRVLQVLLLESSVSRTAEHLGQSQPAVSASLRRLRELTGDPLLVRSGNRLVPTDRALAIKEVVDRILGDVERLADGQAEFDPSTSRRRLRIVASNALCPFLLPPLVSSLRRQAPAMDLELVQQPSGAALANSLETGDVDLVVGSRLEPAQNLRFAPLLECQIACLVPEQHPLARAGQLALDVYLTLDHLSPTPLSIAHWSPIDGRLAQLGLARRIAVAVPEYALVPYVMARTNLVFTTARPLAEHFATMLPFAVVDAPEELGTMHFFMLWHERAHHAPHHQWLRRTVRAVAAGVDTRGGSSGALGGLRLISAA